MAHRTDANDNAFGGVGPGTPRMPLPLQSISNLFLGGSIEEHAHLNDTTAVKFRNVCESACVPWCPCTPRPMIAGDDALNGSRKA